MAKGSKCPRIKIWRFYSDGIAWMYEARADQYCFAL